MMPDEMNSIEDMNAGDPTNKIGEPIFTLKMNRAQLTLLLSVFSSDQLAFRPSVHVELHELMVQLRALSVFVSK